MRVNQVCDSIDIFFNYLQSKVVRFPQVNLQFEMHLANWHRGQPPETFSRRSVVNTACIDIVNE